MTNSVAIVTMRLTGAAAPDQALAVFSRGVFTPPALRRGQSRLWVLHEDKPVPVTVRLGFDDGRYSQILQVQRWDRMVSTGAGDRREIVTQPEGLSVDDKPAATTPKRASPSEGQKHPVSLTWR